MGISPYEGRNQPPNERDRTPAIRSQDHRKAVVHLCPPVDYMIESGKLKHRRIGSRVLVPAEHVRKMAETGCPYGVK